MKYCCFFFIMCSFNTMMGQDALFYQHKTTGKIMTEKMYQEMLVLNQEKLEEPNLEDYYLKEISFETVVRNDSVIKFFDLQFVRDLNKVFARESQKPNAIVGKTFDYQNLIDVNDNQFDVKSLMGKPTLINAWFIECRPCVEEMPALNELMERYKDKVNFVSLTFDDAKKVKKFLKKKPFNFKHLVDGRSVLKDLNVVGYPDNIFLDKNNMIVASNVRVLNYTKKGGIKVKNDVSLLEEYLDYLIAQE